MTYLQLDAREVTAVRRILSVDDPDFAGRIDSLLLALRRLVPSDRLGVVLSDRDGHQEYVVTVPDAVGDCVWPQVRAARHATVQHVVGFPDRAELAGLNGWGIRDRLQVRLAVEGGRTAYVFLDRHTRYFEPRHVEIVSMIQPALAKLVRGPQRPPRLQRLSGTERQVLELVADGSSNQEVAGRLAMSEATVRKHLEHTYRKLGVSNRTAAAAVVHAAASDRITDADLAVAVGA